MKCMSLKDLSLSPEESKEIAELLAQKIGIKDYENISNDLKLLGTLKASENKNKTRIEKIREEIKKLQQKFSRQEIKEIKKIFMRQKTKRVFPHQKRLKNILIN